MTPTELLEHVRVVLRTAARGKGDQPGMVSSYQVLDRLTADVRDTLIAEHGSVGSGVQSHRSAAHVVAQALEMLAGRGEATATYLDTRGIQFQVAGGMVSGGFGPLCKLFRHSTPDSGEAGVVG